MTATIATLTPATRRSLIGTIAGALFTAMGNGITFRL